MQQRPSHLCDMRHGICVIKQLYPLHVLRPPTTHCVTPLRRQAKGIYETPAPASQLFKQRCWGCSKGPVTGVDTGGRRIAIPFLLSSLDILWRLGASPFLLTPSRCKTKNKVFGEGKVRLHFSLHQPQTSLPLCPCVGTLFQ